MSTTNYGKIDFSDVENFEINYLDDIEEYIKNDSMMSSNERRYLNGLIRKIKPCKILEVGVAAGGSSCIILNAIRDISNARLVSIDIQSRLWDFPDKSIGYLVGEIIPDLTTKHSLFLGRQACTVMDEVTENGKYKFDICLLDTVHDNPGEFIHFLEILPYLRKNAIVILHDTNLHNISENIDREKLTTSGITNCILLAALRGKLIRCNDNSRPILLNIGSVILNDDIHEMLWPLFSFLSLPWKYNLTRQHYDELLTHLKNHYPPELVGIFVRSEKFFRPIVKKRLANALRARL
jgi:predicted O-methyltransferase YrrM